MAGGQSLVNIVVVFEVESTKSKKRKCLRLVQQTQCVPGARQLLVYCGRETEKVKLYVWTAIWQKRIPSQLKLLLGGSLLPRRVRDYLALK